MEKSQKGIVWLGSVAGAVTTIGALWIAVGGPIPATSADIKRLDRSQAEAAVEIYQTKLRSLLVLSPPENTTAHTAWEEELRQARESLKRAEDRKIDLSK